MSISLGYISINNEKEGKHIFSRHNPIFANKKNQHLLYKCNNGSIVLIGQ